MSATAFPCPVRKGKAMLFSVKVIRYVYVGTISKRALVSRIKCTSGRDATDLAHALRKVLNDPNDDNADCYIEPECSVRLGSTMVWVSLQDIEWQLKELLKQVETLKQ
jgi:hypothetical protein